MEKIACVVVVLCMVVLSAAPHAQALTCTDVNNYMAACAPYLTTQGDLGNCCDGVRELNDEATTNGEQQTACTCLQAAANAIDGINWEEAAALPNTCDISLPYDIRADFDCSTV